MNDQKYYKSDFAFADLDMVRLQESDILGDAYEYLIGMFAMESVKKPESSIP